MKLIKTFALALLAVVLLASTGYGATLTSTTLSTAVNSTLNQITVASSTSFTAGSLAYVDKEALDILTVNTTTLVVTVRRGSRGTRATSHASGATVYVGTADVFVSQDQAGSCTSANYSYLPLINVLNGKLFRCTNSVWDEEQVITNLKASLGNNLDIQSVSDSKPVRINSRDYTQASGSSIGFQVKPAQTVTNADYVKGGEISPRINSGVAGKGLTGLHVDAYLKGTAAGTITEDVRGIELEMLADNGGTRTISGNVSALRIRSAFSATTITGKFVPIRIEFPESQTNSKTYDAVFELTGTVPLVWNSAPGTEPSTADGYIKVLVNGVARYIQLYSGAPVD